MKIIDATPHFNPVNNGWVYVCGADDGTLWVRSVAGKWAQIDSPVDVQSIIDDFRKAIPVTLDEVKADNTDQVIDAPVDTSP